MKSTDGCRVRPLPSADDFQERRRLAVGQSTPDAALMACLAEVADTWRQLAAAAARRRHLQGLRDGLRAEAATVRALEEAGAATLRSQASCADVSKLPISHGWTVALCQ
jgi:hypothetical protein